ncbi:hypothetical protein M8C21_009170 [Ambrosia artemisiifolia]|uniref:Disease resistance protein At3g14460 n=1 Tax=Ambrosia artemisiifolia TaxID=4212 RepID=A0AAD5BYP4_AMBAR|nr:hypothetical protein M8C21_009170 [Ambrosia artemisiifolia]
MSIKGCVNCKSLPPLGQLPSLKELFIGDMPNVKFIGSELTGTDQFTVSAFPSLEILTFRNMKGWEVWSTNNEVFDAVFPCLRELNIQECPQLIEVSLKPLLSVEILRLRDMRGWKGWSINSEVSVLPYLREFHIDNCPKLIKFPPETTSNKVFDAVFPCLRELNIQECPQLIEVSHKPLLSVEILRLGDMRGWKGWSINSEVSVLPSLRELHINNCPALIKFPPETTNSEVSVLPSLRELHITRCPELIEFSPEKLPELEILRFEDMLGWKIWSTKDAVFPCLRELYIKRCAQLVEAAPSITMLDIWDISGLTYEVWSDVMKHIGAVENVCIENCNEIRYLWESEEEASKVLVNIKKLEVSECSNLVSLGEKEEEDNFGSSLLSSLRTLNVYECNKMERCCCPNSIESLRIRGCSSLTHVSFPTSATGGGGQKLKLLKIDGCSKLMEKINNISTGVLERIDIRVWINLKSLMQLGNFIYLTELYLFNCPNLESFPDIPLPVLTHLKIEYCERMESFSAHQMSNNLTSLKELEIIDCPSIDASRHGGVWPPNLCSLEIGRLKKPMSEWGRHNFPSSLVVLKLYDEADVKNFRQLSHLSFPSSLTYLEIDNFEKLESLSLGLQHLKCLEHLSIKNCPKMKHLPKQLLPSLLSLEIDDCPKLRKRCEGRGSHYYPLISHIPQINFKQAVNKSLLDWAVAVATFNGFGKRKWACWHI